MAKKKKEVIEEAVVEEVIEVATDEEVIEEPTETTDREVVATEVPVADNSDQFIFTQLKAINKMNNPAKARRLAERVLRNKKRGN